MEFLRGVLQVVVLGAVMAGCVSGCDTNAIQGCTSHVAKYMGMSNPPDQVSQEMCNDLTNAINCLQREVNKCGPEVANAMKAAFSALETVKDACKDVDKLNELNKECDTTGIQTCSKQIQSSSHDVKSACSLIVKAKGCLVQFDKSCDNEYFDSLMKGQLKVLDELKDTCSSMGIQVEDPYSSYDGTNSNCIMQGISKCFGTGEVPKDEKVACKLVGGTQSCFQEVKKRCQGSPEDVARLDIQIQLMEKTAKSCKKQNYAITADQGSQTGSAANGDLNCISKGSSKCLEHLSSKPKDKKAYCKFVGKMQTCFNDVKKKCGGVGQDLNIQIQMYENSAQTCKKNGYAITPENSGNKIEIGTLSILLAVMIRIFFV